jgi:hypothetical protein
MPTWKKLSYFDEVAAFAKTQLINSVFGVTIPANVKGFWIFDQVGAAISIPDKAVIGGAAAHPMTLWQPGSGVPDPMSDFSPGVTGLASHLTITGGDVWYVADSADFTFVAPAKFSLIGLFNLNAANASQYLIAKMGAGANEWIMYLDASNYLDAQCYHADGSAYIGRSFAASLAADVGTFHSYGMTYGGGTTNASIKLFRDGAQVDDTNTGSGVFTSMADTASGLQPRYGSAPGSEGNYKVGVILIMAEELTAVQVARLDAILRGYAGIVY